MPSLHASITELTEPQLISHVLSDPHYRETLLNIHGIFTERARVLEQVELRPLRQGVFGDVDILISPRGKPELSTAIQVKRFEAIIQVNESGEDKLEGGNPERFRKLMAKGVQQANLTKQLGFGQVYLWVFVVIDAREKNNGWYSYEGPDSVVQSEIRSAMSTPGLDPTVGIMQFEWVQPMDRPPFELCTHGGHLVRLAQSTPQRPEVTNWLAALPSPVLVLPKL